MKDESYKKYQETDELLGTTFNRFFGSLMVEI